MPAINATAGSATANSFVTVTEVEAYADARLNSSAWTDETDDDTKVRAIISATRELSTRSDWCGMRVTDTQALSWPRQYAEDPDSPWPGSLFFTTSEIPQRVKDATCELTIQLLAQGTTDFSLADTTSNVRVKTVGPLTTEYFDPYQRVQGLTKFPLVLGMIRPLLTGSGANSAPILRG